MFIFISWPWLYSPLFDLNFTIHLQCQLNSLSVNLRFTALLILSFTAPYLTIASYPIVQPQLHSPSFDLSSWSLIGAPLCSPLYIFNFTTPLFFVLVVCHECCRNDNIADCISQPGSRTELHPKCKQSLTWDHLERNCGGLYRVVRTIASKNFEKKARENCFARRLCG